MYAVIFFIAFVAALNCSGKSGSMADDIPDAGSETSPDSTQDSIWECNFIEPVVLNGAALYVNQERAALQDAFGREVILRGVNAGSRSKWAPFLPFSIAPEADISSVKDAAEKFFSIMPAWGFNAVRLVFSWEAMEPFKGQIDHQYLDRYEAMVDAAWKFGVRVIVDMHQDIYSSPFCGDGFPPWTIKDPEPGPPLHDCESWYMKYFTDPGVIESFDRFWADEDGIQTAFKEMWSVVAKRFAGSPGVTGFEIINEPGWGSASNFDAWKKEVLIPFYSELTEIIHSSAPDALVFYDGIPVDAVIPEKTYYRPEGENLVFAPHYYDSDLFMGLEWAGTDPMPVLEKFAAFRDKESVPVLLGEFGIHPGVEGGMEWLDLFMDAVDELRFSATIWEYSLSEELWNHEDFSITNPDGTARESLEVYVRPWLRAVAGTGSSFSWDPDTGGADAAWTAGTGVTEIAVPSFLFPAGPKGLVVEGEGVCHTWDPERGELRVSAPKGAHVHVTFKK